MNINVSLWDSLYICGTADATDFGFVVQFAFIQLKVTWAISLFTCHIHSLFKWYKIIKKSVKASRSYCQFFMDHSVYSMCAWYTVRKCIMTPKWRCWWGNVLRIWNTRHCTDSEFAWTYILLWMAICWQTSSHSGWKVLLCQRPVVYLSRMCVSNSSQNIAHTVPKLKCETDKQCRQCSGNNKVCEWISWFSWRQITSSYYAGSRLAAPAGRRELPVPSGSADW